jgi:thymidylate synthase
MWIRTVRGWRFIKVEKTQQDFWNPDDSMLSVEQVKHMEIDDFILNGYQSHPTIKAPLSN